MRYQPRGPKRLGLLEALTGTFYVPADKMSRAEIGAELGKSRYPGDGLPRNFVLNDGTVVSGDTGGGISNDNVKGIEYPLGNRPVEGETGGGRGCVIPLVVIAAVVVVGLICYGATRIIPQRLAVIGAAAGAQQSPALDEQSLVAENSAAPTDSPTAEPTYTPMPTVDYSAAYPIQTQAQAAKELAISQQALADAQATIAESAARIAGASATSQMLTILGGTPTAQAIATGNALSTESAYATDIANQQHNALIAQQNDAETRHARELADITNRQNMTTAGIVFVALFGAGLLWLAMRAIDRHQWSQTMSNFPVTGDDMLNAPPPSDSGKGFLPVGSSTYHSANVPVPDKVFRVWAERMLAGETAGINKWETAESPFGRVGYKPFLAWAEERGYVEERGGAKVLSDIGRNFCAGWLERHPTTSPSRSQTPETA